MDEEFTAVSIPTSLYRKIEAAIGGKGEATVTSYIVNVLREALSKSEAGTEGLSPEDEEKVKQRLKALGYID